jgi:hypothetical protein
MIHLEEIFVNGSTILKHISNAYDDLACTGMIWLGIRTSGGPLRKR